MLGFFVVEGTGVEELLVRLGPVTLGAFLGYAVGYALKKAFKLLLLLLGLAFILRQLLAYLGYLEINRARIEQELAPYLVPGIGRRDRSFDGDQLRLPC